MQNKTHRVYVYICMCGFISQELIVNILDFQDTNLQAMSFLDVLTRELYLNRLERNFEMPCIKLLIEGKFQK